jgi:mono/diheme cytochrome c family protein
MDDKMKALKGRAVRLLLGVGFFGLTTGIVAQSTKPGPSFKPNPNLSDQEKRGEYLFLQRCALCHVTKYSKDVSAPKLPPVWLNLEGLFKNAESGQEETVREFILNGTVRMPGWKYTLGPKQIDDLIAYLKTL